MSARIFLIVLFLAALPTFFACGERNYQGQLLDSSNKPMAGVKVSVKGSNAEITTDKEGRFFTAVMVKNIDEITFSADSSWPEGCFLPPLIKHKPAGSNEAIDKSLGVYTIPCIAEKDDKGRTVYLSQDRSWLDDGELTVSDLASRIMWQKKVTDVKVTWWRASRYCEELELAGYDDWTLPSSDDMSRLLAPGKPIALNPFFNRKKYRYWSSTDDAENNSNAMAVYDVNGAAGVANRSVPYLVRCSRSL